MVLLWLVILVQRPAEMLLLLLSCKLQGTEKKRAGRLLDLDRQLIIRVSTLWNGISLDGFLRVDAGDQLFFMVNDTSCPGFGFDREYPAGRGPCTGSF